MRKESFIISKNGTFASSGPSNPIPNISYLTTDTNGNISTTSDGKLNNLDVEGNITLQGYPGNPGDVLVSNGTSAPPVWTGIGNIQKLIAFKPYILPPVQLQPGDTIVTVPINFPITPNMIIIVEMTMTSFFPNLWHVYAIGVRATIGNKSVTLANGTDSNSNGWYTNFKFVFTGLSGNSNILTIEDSFGVYYSTNPPAQDHVFVYAVEAP